MESNRLEPVRRTPILEGWIEVEAFPVSHGRDPRLPPNGDWDQDPTPAEPEDPIAASKLQSGSVDPNTTSEPRDSISSHSQHFDTMLRSSHSNDSQADSGIAPSQPASRATSQSDSHQALASAAHSSRPSSPAGLRRTHSFAFDMHPATHSTAPSRSGSTAASARLPYAHSYPYTNSLNFNFEGPAGTTRRRSSLHPSTTSSSVPHGFAYSMDTVPPPPYGH